MSYIRLSSQTGDFFRGLFSRDVSTRPEGAFKPLNSNIDMTDESCLCRMVNHTYHDAFLRR
jgi:hypothetical protein